MVSTLRRWRLFRPWMEKPCSRVLRKLSGELTTIQYWAARPPPALRLRRPRRDELGFSRSAGALASGSSDTTGRLLAVRAGLWDRAQVLRLGQQGAQVADLGDVPHLVPGHQPANLKESQVAAARVVDRALPLVLAPAVQEVDRTPADPGEIVESLLQRLGQVLVVAGIDRRADVGGPLSVQVRVAQQGVDLARRVDQVGDEAAQRGERRAVAVAKAGLVEPVHEVAGPLRHRAHQQDHVPARHLFLEFHHHRLAGSQTGPRPSTFRGMSAVFGPDGRPAQFDGTAW